MNYTPLSSDRSLTVGSVENATNIALALSKVNNLGRKADDELDDIAALALKSYEDLMDLGMNVEPRFSSRLFEIAASMLKTGLDAKTAKHDKNLKIVDLQMKKLKIDAPPKQYVTKKEREKKEEKRDVIITDRNSLLKQLKQNYNKEDDDSNTE